MAGVGAGAAAGLAAGAGAAAGLAAGGLGLLRSCGAYRGAVDRCLDGKRGADAGYAYEDGKAPCGLLDEVGGLAITEVLVVVVVLRRQTATFGFLDENHSDEQEACNHDYDAEKDIHFIVF